MHDPNTLAFSVGGFLEIWHIDPCTGGDDDSAGWFSPRIKADDLKNIEALIKGDLESNLTDKSNLEIILWIWKRVKWRKWHKTSVLNASEISYAIELAANTVDNLDGPIKSARKIDARNPERQWEWLVGCIYKAVLRHHRKWWQHPRWQFWRWQIKITKPFRLKFGRRFGDAYFD